MTDEYDPFNPTEDNNADFDTTDIPLPGAIPLPGSVKNGSASNTVTETCLLAKPSSTPLPPNEPAPLPPPPPSEPLYPVQNTSVISDIASQAYVPTPVPVAVPQPTASQVANDNSGREIDVSSLSGSRNSRFDEPYSTSAFSGNKGPASTSFTSNKSDAKSLKISFAIKSRFKPLAPKKEESTNDEEQTTDAQTMSDAKNAVVSEKEPIIQHANVIPESKAISENKISLHMAKIEKLDAKGAATTNTDISHTLVKDTAPVATDIDFQLRKDKPLAPKQSQLKKENTSALYSPLIEEPLEFDNIPLDVNLYSPTNTRPVTPPALSPNKVEPDNKGPEQSAIKLLPKQLLKPKHTILSDAIHSVEQSIKQSLKETEKTKSHTNNSESISLDSRPDKHALSDEKKSKQREHTSKRSDVRSRDRSHSPTSLRDRKSRDNSREKGTHRKREESDHKSKHRGEENDKPNQSRSRDSRDTKGDSKYSRSEKDSERRRGDKNRSLRSSSSERLSSASSRSSDSEGDEKYSSRRRRDKRRSRDSRRDRRETLPHKADKHSKSHSSNHDSRSRQSRISPEKAHDSKERKDSSISRSQDDAKSKRFGKSSEFAPQKQERKQSSQATDDSDLGVDSLLEEADIPLSKSVAEAKLSPTTEKGIETHNTSTSASEVKQDCVSEDAANVKHNSAEENASSEILRAKEQTTKEHIPPREAEKETETSENILNNTVNSSEIDKETCGKNTCATNNTMEDAAAVCKEDPTETMVTPPDSPSDCVVVSVDLSQQVVVVKTEEDGTQEVTRYINRVKQPEEEPEKKSEEPEKKSEEPDTTDVRSRRSQSKDKRESRKSHERTRSDRRSSGSRRRSKSKDRRSRSRDRRSHSRSRTMKSRSRSHTRRSRSRGRRSRSRTRRSRSRGRRSRSRTRRSRSRERRSGSRGRRSRSTDRRSRSKDRGARSIDRRSTSRERRRRSRERRSRERREERRRRHRSPTPDRYRRRRSRGDSGRRSRERSRKPGSVVDSRKRSRDRGDSRKRSKERGSSRNRSKDRDDSHKRSRDQGDSRKQSKDRHDSRKSSRDRGESQSQRSAEQNSSGSNDQAASSVPALVDNIPLPSSELIGVSKHSGVNSDPSAITPVAYEKEFLLPSAAPIDIQCDSDIESVEMEDSEDITMEEIIPIAQAEKRETDTSVVPKSMPEKVCFSLSLGKKTGEVLKDNILNRIADDEHQNQSLGQQELTDKPNGPSPGLDSSDIKPTEAKDTAALSVNVDTSGSSTVTPILSPSVRTKAALKQGTMPIPQAIQDMQQSAASLSGTTNTTHQVRSDISATSVLPARKRWTITESNEPSDSSLRTPLTVQESFGFDTNKDKLTNSVQTEAGDVEPVKPVRVRKSRFGPPLTQAPQLPAPAVVEPGALFPSSQSQLASSEQESTHGGAGDGGNTSADIPVENRVEAPAEQNSEERERDDNQMAAQSDSAAKENEGGGAEEETTPARRRSSRISRQRERSRSRENEQTPKESKGKGKRGGRRRKEDTEAESTTENQPSVAQESGDQATGPSGLTIKQVAVGSSEFVLPDSVPRRGTSSGASTPGHSGSDLCSPPRPPVFCSPPPPHPGPGTSPGPGSNMKLKSRWRRFSELEGMSDGSNTAGAGETSPTHGSTGAAQNVEESSGSASDEPAPPPPPAEPATNHTTTDEQATEGPAKDDPPPPPAPPETPPKPPPFEYIVENLFLCDRKRSKARKEAKRMVCDCTLPSQSDRARGVQACGEDCLNRLLMIECGSRCPCGDYCTNKRFQRDVKDRLVVHNPDAYKNHYGPVEPFFTGSKGWGIRATRDIPAGEFLIEYVGEVLDHAEFRRRARTYDKKQHYYFMALNAHEIVDATYKGNVSRFTNHSCDPVAETQKWTVNGQLRIGFFTIKSMRAGHEVTFDYQYENYGQEAQTCYCGAENCRGTLGKARSAPALARDEFLFGVPTTEEADLDRAGAERRRRKKERKRNRIFDDIVLREEIERLQSLGGLRRREHVLELSRLMVRAESVDHRAALLTVLLTTKEPNCLRLFLDYQGLQLLWSWMVDMPSDANSLKLKLLETLRQLPITNRTVLKESKILMVVTKWASSQDRTVSSSDTLKSKFKSKVKLDQPSPVRPGHPLSQPDTESDTEVETETDTKFSTKTDTPVSNEIKTEADKSDVVKQETVNDTPMETIETKLDTETSIVKNDNDVKEEGEVEGTPKREEESEQDRKEQGEQQETSENVSQASSQPSSQPPSPPPPPKDTHSEGPMNKKRRLLACIQIDASDSESDSLEVKGGKGAGETASQPIKIDDESWVASSDERGLLDTSQDGSEGDAQGSGDDPPEAGDTGDTGEGGDESQGDESDETTREQLQARVVELAAELLRAWKDLKEQFKIPKIKVEERKKREREMELKESERGYRDDSRDSQRPAWGGARGWRGERKRPALDSPDDRRNGDDKRRRPTDSDDRSRVERDRVNKVLTPTPPRGPKMSKEQHRKLFELQVKAEDQIRKQQEEQQQQAAEAAEAADTALQQQQQYTADQSAYPPEYATDPAYAAYYQQQSGEAYAGYSQSYATEMPTTDPSYVSQVVSMATTPYQQQQHYVDSNTGQIVYQTAGTVYQAPTTYQAQYQTQTGVTYVQQSQPVSLQPVYYQTPNGQVIVQQVQTVTATPASQLIHVTSHDPTTLQQDQLVALQHQHVLTAPQPTEQPKEPPPPPPSPPPRQVRLPPNWKTAKDSDGKLYYYHTVTRQTQWDPPEWESGTPEDTADVITPVYDEPVKPKKRKAKASTAIAADSSSEAAKRTRDNFRAKMSKYMIKYLGPFRRSDCKAGRITNDQDFKHLARKLTHAVLDKELKYCRHMEDLEVNDSVKAKAKDFVHKYMRKCGPVYKGKSSDAANDAALAEDTPD